MSTVMKSEMKSVKFSTDYGNVIASDYINQDGAITINSLLKPTWIIME